MDRTQQRQCKAKDNERNYTERKDNGPHIIGWDGMDNQQKEERKGKQQVIYTVSYWRRIDGDLWTQCQSGSMSESDSESVTVESLAV